MTSVKCSTPINLYYESNFNNIARINLFPMFSFEYKLQKLNHNQYYRCIYWCTFTLISSQKLSMFILFFTYLNIISVITDVWALWWTSCYAALFGLWYWRLPEEWPVLLQCLSSTTMWTMQRRTSEMSQKQKPWNCPLPPPQASASCGDMPRPSNKKFRHLL